MEYTTFKRQITRLAVAYNQDPDGPQMAMYWERLKSHDDSLFAEAIDRAMDSERFFPTIATLHGHCDRVRDEMAQRQTENTDTLTLRPGTNLPMCGTCNDAGWASVPSRASNQPGRLERCPDCAGQIKGRDPGRPQVDLDAYMYFLDHDRAAHPPLPDLAPPRAIEDENPPPPNFAKPRLDAIPETPHERARRLVDESMRRMAKGAAR